MESETTSTSAEKPNGLAGIMNIGNTCYANSVIQALRIIPEWTLMIEKATVPKDETAEPPLNSVQGSVCPPASQPKALTLGCEPHHKVFDAYQDVARSLWLPDTTLGAYCRPMGFWRTVREAIKDGPYESFGYNMPHDAHEFINYIVDQCHEALKTAATTTDVALYKSLNHFTSPVVDTLFGWDRVTVTCSECSNENAFYEAFNMLKVGLNSIEAKSPIDLFRDERTDETIEDYTCDKCAKKTNATLKRRLWSLPRNLFFVLRRFRSDGFKDCSEYLYDGEPIKFEEFFDSASTSDSRAFSFKPIALIDHLGSHRGGHYVAQTYHPLLQNWYLFDDESCRPLDHAHFNAHNYIIVFRANVA